MNQHYLMIWRQFILSMFHIFQLRQKILEAHVNVKDLNLLEAKMNFIKAWQSLPDYGVSLFVVRFHGEKREELLGVAFNRIMRMSLQSGDHIKTWRFNTIKVWISLNKHCNWYSILKIVSMRIIMHYMFIYHLSGLEY